MASRLLGLVIVASAVCCSFGQTAEDLQRVKDLQQQLDEINSKITNGETDVTSPKFRMDGGNLNIRVPRDAQMKLHTQSTIDITALDSRLSDLENNVNETARSATVKATAGMLGSVDTTLKDLTTAHNKFKTDLDSQVQEAMDALKAEVKRYADEITNDRLQISFNMTNEFENQKEALVQQIKSAETSLASSTSNTLIELKKSLGTTKDSLTSLSASVGEKHVWIGGSTSHIRHGWRDFLLQREEFNTGAPYFKREGNRFRVLKDGFYRLQYGGIMHGGWCHNHMEVRVNGKRIRDSTHNYVPGTWQNAEFETTWFVKANQQMWFRVYGCNYFNHGSGGYDAHNRLVFSYVGAKGKCSGKYCNGI